MKTMVAETSLEAYHSLPVADYLQPRERDVMALFQKESTTLTRKQIAACTGLELSCVCGRVNSLVTKNRLAVRGDSIDHVTGKRQEVLGLPLLAQACFFDQQREIDRAGIAEA